VVCSGGLKGGRKTFEQIDERYDHDKLLLVLSEASMESEWVKTGKSPGTAAGGSGEAAGVVPDSSCSVRDYS